MEQKTGHPLTGGTYACQKSFQSWGQQSSGLVPAIGAKCSMKHFLSLRSVTGPEKIDPNWGRDGETHAAACACGVCMPVDFLKKESALPVHFEGSTKDIIAYFHVPLGVLQAIEGQMCVC